MKLVIYSRLKPIAIASLVSLFFILIYGLVISLPFSQPSQAASPTVVLKPQEQVKFTPSLAAFEINQIRAQVKLPPLIELPALNESASDHSIYLMRQEGGKISHYQKNRSSPYFRGTTPSERILRTYPTANATGEVLGFVTGTNWRKVVQGLVDAPYHRIVLLGNFSKLGTGIERGTFKTSDNQNQPEVIFTANLADQGSPFPEGFFTPWPYPGQLESPLDWLAFEMPLPIPQQYFGRRVGYPISLQVDNPLRLTDLQISLTSPIKANSSRLDTHNETTGYLNYTTDPNQNGKASNYMIFVPNRPLLANHIYSVIVSGNLLQANGAKKPFRVGWKFTTTGAKPLTISANPPVTRLLQNQSIELIISGGTGNYQNEKGMHFTLSQATGNDQMGVPLELETISDTHYRLTNRCNSKIECKIRFTAVDSATTTSVNLVFVGHE